MSHSNYLGSRPAFYLVVLGLIGATSNAGATLTPITKEDGTEMVYSSVSNVLWARDANLFGTMSQREGYSTLVSNILDASRGISYGSTDYLLFGGLGYRLDAQSFSREGLTTWEGSMAFVHYLNTIKYAGYQTWRLPSANDTEIPGCNSIASYGGSDCGYSIRTNGATTGSELAELYYSELSALPSRKFNGSYQFGAGIPDTDIFINEERRTRPYWYGTEFSTDRASAWVFHLDEGYQYKMLKNLFHGNAWVLVDSVSAVPEPETYAMMLAGLGLIAGVARRRKKDQAV